MNINAPQNCFITGLPTEGIPDSRDRIITYKIISNSDEYILSFNPRVEHWFDDLEFVESNEFDNIYYINNFLKEKKHLVAGLLLNNKIIDLDQIIFSKKTVNKILKEYDYPKSTWEKLNNLFIKLFEMQRYDGSPIDTVDIYDDYLLYYFKNEHELNYYMTNLDTYGLIEDVEKAESGMYFSCRISIKGFDHYNTLQTTGKNSNNCFVAMSFADEHKYIYNDAIQNAITETGFKPIIVNEEDAAPEQSINDLIIAKLKECKFVIADFTSHRNGVYFEAGYALGRGLKVIYTCKKEDWEQTHFDTNRYQYIIWSTTEELKQALINKINAYIKD